MPRITFQFSCKNSPQQILSAQDLRNRYLFGLRLEQNKQPIPDDVYDNFIESAIQEIEKFLSIKLRLQIIEENKHYAYDQWIKWGFIRTTYPIQCPLALDGFIGTIKQVQYPKEWLSVRKTSDKETISRNMYIVPNANSTYQQAIIYSGILPNIGAWRGANGTPNYWNIKYTTGFFSIPKDIEHAIALLACMNILTVANESMASAMGALGTSSKSISLDGLSQSVSMYVNGQTGIFGARIKQYGDMLMGVGGQPGLLDRLRDYYGAIIMAVG